MKYFICLLFFFPLVTGAQKIASDQVDELTGNRIVKTTYESLGASLYNVSVAQQTMGKDTATFLILSINVNKNVPVNKNNNVHFTFADSNSLKLPYTFNYTTAYNGDALNILVQLDKKNLDTLINKEVAKIKVETKERSIDIDIANRKLDRISTLLSLIEDYCSHAYTQTSKKSSKKDKKDKKDIAKRREPKAKTPVPATPQPVKQPVINSSQIVITKKPTEPAKKNNPVIAGTAVKEKPAQPDAKESPTPTNTTFVSGQFISLNDVNQHVGDSVKVCGKIFTTRYLPNSGSSPTLLNVGAAYPRQLLTLVIYGAYRNKFAAAPENFYQNKHVCVTGKVELYNNKPQIVIRSSEQITLQQEGDDYLYSRQ